MLLVLNMKMSFFVVIIVVSVIREAVRDYVILVFFPNGLWGHIGENYMKLMLIYLLTFHVKSTSLFFKAGVIISKKFGFWYACIGSLY